MGAAGLRFSTLGTNRYCSVHKLYRQHGYVDLNVWATELACSELAHQPTRLRAQSVSHEGFECIDKTSNDFAGE